MDRIHQWVVSRPLAYVVLVLAAVQAIVLAMWLAITEIHGPRALWLVDVVVLVVFGLDHLLFRLRMIGTRDRE